MWPWLGGSPARGILHWILSVVQARRVGRGDAPHVSQRAAASHRRPVLASTHIAPRRYHGGPQRPSGVIQAFAGWVQGRIAYAPTGWQQGVRDSAAVAERSAGFPQLPCLCLMVALHT